MLSNNNNNSFLSETNENVVELIKISADIIIEYLEYLDKKRAGLTNENTLSEHMKKFHNNFIAESVIAWKVGGYRTIDLVADNIFQFKFKQRHDLNQIATLLEVNFNQRLNNEKRIDVLSKKINNTKDEYERNLIKDIEKITTEEQQVLAAEMQKFNLIARFFDGKEVKAAKEIISTTYQQRKSAIKQRFQQGINNSCIAEKNELKKLKYGRMQYVLAMKLVANIKQEIKCMEELEEHRANVNGKVISLNLFDDYLAKKQDDNADPFSGGTIRKRKNKGKSDNEELDKFEKQPITMPLLSNKKIQ